MIRKLKTGFNVCSKTAFIKSSLKIISCLKFLTQVVNCSVQRACVSSVLYFLCFLELSAFVISWILSFLILDQRRFCQELFYTFIVFMMGLSYTDLSLSYTNTQIILLKLLVHSTQALSLSYTNYQFIPHKLLVYPTQTLSSSYTNPQFILHKPLVHPIQTLSSSYTNPQFILNNPLVHPEQTLSLSYPIPQFILNKPFSSSYIILVSSSYTISQFVHPTQYLSQLTLHNILVCTSYTIPQFILQNPQVNLQKPFVLPTQYLSQFILHKPLVSSSYTNLQCILHKPQFILHKPLVNPT